MKHQKEQAKSIKRAIAVALYRQASSGLGLEKRFRGQKDLSLEWQGRNKPLRSSSSALITGRLSLSYAGHRDQGGDNNQPFYHFPDCFSLCDVPAHSYHHLEVRFHPKVAFRLTPHLVANKPKQSASRSDDSLGGGISGQAALVATPMKKGLRVLI